MIPPAVRRRRPWGAGGATGRGVPLIPLLALLAAGAPPRLAAQDGALHVDLGASYAVPPAGETGEASEYLNAGVRLAGFFGRSLYVHVGGFGGLGLRPDGADWASVIGGGGVLAPVSGFLALGISATGEAFAVGSPFPYRGVTLRVEPEVRLGGEATSLSVRGFGGLGSSEVRVVQSFTRDTRFGPRTYEVGLDVATDLWSWGGGLELRHRIGPAEPIAALELHETPQGSYVVARLGMEVALRGAVLYAEGSLWDTPDGSEYGLVAGLRVLAGGGSSFLATGGRYGPDPLLDAPAAGGAGATLSLQVTDFEREEESRYEVGGGAEPWVRILLRAPDAATVSVMGEFTDWREVPMTRGDRSWSVSLSVERGAHHFGFVVDGEWYVPEDAPGRTTDEWGGAQATLIVP